MSTPKKVQIIKVPGRFLIMDSDTLLAAARREFIAADICKTEGWTSGPMQEFGGWLKSLTEKPTKSAAPKPTKSA